MKIERIMVPTDFSEHSLVSLKYALDLARDHTSEVVLLHVVEPLPYGIARWSEPTKLLEHRARTFLEGFESAETLVAAQRTAVLIKNRNFAAANQKAPFAADAVVDSCLLLKYRKLKNGSNNELMPGNCWPVVDGTGAVLPKIHDLALGQLPDQPKAYGF